MYLICHGHRIFYRTWPVIKPMAVFVISHGLGEHSGRYQKLAEYLNGQGCSVYALDHQGHGRSEGKRGHVESFEDYGRDLHSFINWVKLQQSHIPIHLLGHSMGGLIVTAYAMRYKDVSSIILSSPGFRGKKKISRLKYFMANFLEKIVPQLSLNNELDINGISHSKAIIKDYCNDALVHSKISPRWFISFVKESKFVSNHLNQFNLPCLMLLAGSDLLVDSNISEEYFKGFSSSTKILRHYPRAYHEILNEIDDGPLAFSEISRWMRVNLLSSDVQVAAQMQ